ncbi:MAG: CvpA family protein [Clostridia bacterium]|nr:CvpA family protein [Clostridia bacterium]MDD3862561.1 CvpA family protein [Clostridia bacterium]
MSGIIIDLIFVGILVIFSVIGMYKGFFSTLLSLLGFLGTVVVAFLFRHQMVAILDSIFNLTPWLSATFGDSAANIIAVIIGIIITYILIRILIFILNHTIGKIFKGKLLGKANAVLGLFLGFFKGVLYVSCFFAIIYIATVIPPVKTFVNDRLEGTLVTGYVYSFVGEQIVHNLVSEEETVPENQ